MPGDATYAPPRGEAEIGAFRRADHVPANYSAARHAGTTLFLAALIGGFGLRLAMEASALDLLFVPLFFLAANFIEWMVHKNPMHRPLPPRFMYKNHAIIHHRSFEQDTMPVNDTRELSLVMMPWYTMLGLFVIASPIAFVGAMWRGWGVAGLFYLTAAGYFLLYEGMHALYHLPPETLRRLGLGGSWFARLRAHHAHHHRLDRMAHVNFNVTFPIMDTLLGTKERDGEEPVRRRRASTTA